MFAVGKETTERLDRFLQLSAFVSEGKNAPVLLLSITSLAVFGRSSPQDRAYEAQEQVHEERLNLVDEYRECVEEAGDDKLKAGACDHYLKAAEALK